jgi:hypothetical protein
LIDDAEVFEPFVELHDRERRQSPQFGHRNFSNISGAGFPNTYADAFQAFSADVRGPPTAPIPRIASSRRRAESGGAVVVRLLRGFGHETLTVVIKERSRPRAQWAPDGPISVVTRYADTGCHEEIDVTHLAVDTPGATEHPNGPRVFAAKRRR